MSKKSRHHHETPDYEEALGEAAAVPQDLLTHPAYEELLNKLNDAEQKYQEYWERILRMQADAENASRRAERDVANAHKYALERFANELLPIVDSLELCLKNTPAEISEQTQAVLEGVKLTLKLFYGAMEKFGIEQVNPEGSLFDSEHQQAISMQLDTSVPAGTVLSVLQKGYTLNGRLLRPALVVVSKTAE